MTLRLCICLLLISAQHAHAQFSGLIFTSRETAPEKRTGLSLTPDAPFCFSDSFQLNFDISFIAGKERYSGYIFRIINENNENLDLLFDGRDRLFKVVYKEAFTKIIFPASVFDWNKFSLRYDGHTGISFWLNDKLVARSTGVLKDLCLRLFFGANYYHGFRSTDLPSMMIRNLAVEGGGAVKYFWPLNELDGDVALDSISNKKATVLNPSWVRSRHERWESAGSFAVKGNPSIAFDPAAEQLLIVNNDSFYTFDAKTKQLSAVALRKAGSTLPPGNQSVYYPPEKKLYNFYTDRKHVATYDPTTQQWDPDLPADRSLTAFWHVNKFISARDSSLYIMGGYGYNKYKNLIQRFHLHQHTWDTVKNSGDYFEPRYLSALGQNAAGDTAWLLGGYGSQSGDQMLSPRYYYELYVFDVQHGKLSKRFTLKEPEDHFVFANSLVINDTGQSYYALIYPKDRYDTKLQLIKGSLTAPAYQLVGDEMPYWFNDAKSFADLFYCATSQLLMAVTVSHKEDTYASVNIYTIATPPDAPLAAPAVTGGRSYLYSIGALAAILLLTGIVILKKKKKKIPSPVRQAENSLTGPQQPQPLPIQKPGIFLFGNFTIIDKEGADITNSFTPLLKELFLMILIYTIKYGKGVTLEKLNETLWSDMDEKNAKNNRAVNIGKIKNILERLGDCTLKKVAGRWTFVFNPEEINVDLARYNDMNQLLDIVRRGAFLPQEKYEWLDDIKSDISNNILDRLQKFSAGLPMADNAEALIDIAQSIFAFDELNEDALVMKCKSLVFLGRYAIAKNVYQKFVSKYQDIYGEAFKTSFTEITAR